MPLTRVRRGQLQWGYCQYLEENALPLSLESELHEDQASRPPADHHCVGRDKETLTVKHVKLADLGVSRIGLGAMGMSFGYTGAGADNAESISTIHRALELGVTFIDTAEIYGPYTNEELVGQAIKGRRDQVVIATKFGMVSHAGGGPGHLDSSLANIRVAVEGSM